MQTDASGQIFRFGPFELDLGNGELRKRGIRLALQEQPLRILAALLERPGEAVSREDLCHRLWPEGTFVDFEHSLNAAVRRLRTTLGDTAETPRFIETVHRRGYRFLVWGLAVADTRPVTVARPAALLPPHTVRRARLAVLPFVSFAADSRQDVFSEGLTDEVLTQVARGCPAHVGVIARTSAMRAVTGAALGADYFLEGSIRREGERVRISAQLIDAQDDTHLWAATYDRVGADMLTLQTDVAAQIASAVAEALSARRPLLSHEAAS